MTIEIIVTVLALLISAILLGLTGLAIIHILTPPRKDPHAKRKTPR